MAQAKTRNPRFVTPAGLAVFPHILTPDTKFNADGVYQTELSLPMDAIVTTSKGESLGSFQEWLDAATHEAYEKAVAENAGKKDKKGKPVVVVEADAPYRIDGDKLIPKFKLNATGKTRTGEVFTQQPAVFDAKGKPAQLERLWSGSTIKVSFELVPYFMESTKQAGVSLRMKAVQVIELRTSGGGDGSAYGFGEEEGFEDEGQASGFSSEEDGPDYGAEEEYRSTNGDF